MKQKNNLTHNYQTKLLSFLKKNGIAHPKSLAIYQEALTHKSYANENNLNYNYERLEFLGDAAIDWVITNYLFNHEKHLDEGHLSLTRSNLVKRDTLSMCCKEIGLDKLILLGKGAQNNTSNESIYEDVFESFIGAVARDQGIKKVINILEHTLIKHYNKMGNFDQKDAKTTLQEILQSKGSHPPEYIKKTDDNAKIKIIEVWFNHLKYGEGSASSFKDAEQLAAQDALNKMASHKQK